MTKKKNFEKENENSSLDLEYLHALNSTLSEWDSEEDTEACKEI